MVSPPDPDHPERNELSSARRSRFRRLRRIALPVGAAVTAGAAGIGWYGWQFAQNQLPAIVATNLSQLLDRPVQVGAVQQLGFNHLRLGPSSLPPTPADPTRVTTEGVSVKFNPLQVLTNRTLDLDVTVDRPSLDLRQDAEGQWAHIKLQPQPPGRIQVNLQQLQFRDGRATLLPYAPGGQKQVPVEISQMQGGIRISDNNTRFTYNLAGQSNTGGRVEATGETRTLPAASTQASTATDLRVQANQLSVATLTHLAGLSNQVAVKSGKVNSNLAIQVRPQQKTPTFNGVVQVQDVNLETAQLPQPIAIKQGSFNLQNNRVTVSKTQGSYGSIPASLSGEVDLEQGFNLTAKTGPVSLATLTKTLNLKPPVPVAGELQTSLNLTGPIKQPVLSGRTRSTKPGLVDRVALSQYGADFRFDTASRTLVLSQVEATPTAGGQIQGAGRIKLGPKPKDTQVAFILDGQDLPADALARPYNQGRPLPITVGPVALQTTIKGPANQLQTVVRWQAPQATYAASGEIVLANGVTTLGNTRVAVAQGTVTANARIQNGQWKADIAADQLALNQFSPQLRGQFSGQFTAGGRVNALNPAGIQASGEARLSEGLAMIRDPLTANLTWNGQQLMVNRATAPGFSASGTILAQLDGPGAPAIQNFNFNVQASNVDLNQLGLKTPVPIAYAGRADFNGTIKGTPTQPVVRGNVALRDFTVNQIAFDPVMTGIVTYDQGVNLNLTGEQDRIDVRLSSAFQPIDFTLRRGQAIATGTSLNGNLVVEAEQFPLSVLGLMAASAPGAPDQLPISGTLKGKITLNLANRSAVGTVTLDKPGVGLYQADQFQGQIALAGGVVTLTDGVLTQRQTALQVSGQANLQDRDPSFTGTIATTDAHVQDVLTLLQIFDVEDMARGGKSPTFGNAADVQTASVGRPNATIESQIRRLSEIQAELAGAAAKREAAALPPLNQLTGLFSGGIKLAGSLKNGVKASFDFQGQDWLWGTFKAEQVAAIGTFDQGRLSLLPVRLQTGDSVISLAGQFGQGQQSGQLRMENIPAERVAALLRLRASVTGTLNATATLSGDLANPQAIGEVRLANGSLNEAVINKAGGAFRYGNARLEFGSNIFFSGPEPVSILGSIPFQLPFASVAPDSDRISLDFNVRNEGMEFINGINRQLSWVEGEGGINLQIRGTLAQPVAIGIASIKNATLKAQALPEPLTDVNGVIRFNFDKATVENLNGTFSQGKVVANGSIPISDRSNPLPTEETTPLTVSLEKIRLKLKNLFEGNVDGQLVVARSLLNPTLGGEIRLSQGKIELIEPAASPAGAPGNQSNPGLEFDNLKLTLGDRMRLVRELLLNFVASGTITINGSAQDLQPVGVISLRSGQVNLFTTQFNLDRGYPQTATFEPRYGLDPFLDVRLVTTVAEVTQSRLPSTANSAEILDASAFNTNIGSLQTIRVQAKAYGLASQISENLVLTSSPLRSESEIVSLIGGGFINTFMSGEPTAGLANLAGSVLLTNFQNFISRTLGLTQFRIFPAFVPQTTRDRNGNEQTTTTFGVGLEAGVDITRSLSVSVLQLLTASDAVTSSDATQFSLRYRINDQLLLRGSTNFSGDNRAVIEYENRF